MNLIQIQERLKDAPVQAIMQYANGSNPMVPPYLALAELKRRESINQSAQAQQAMQQGQQPSVKQQVEQAAGLAALQQQMQQQGMQGLMAQARPQSIPQNIPQPQRQPEPEGVAGLPAGDFNFADGGIVAFQGGGETGIMSIEQMRAEYQRLLRANRRVEANEMFEKIKTRQEMESRPITTPVAPMDEAMPTAPQTAITPRAEAPEGVRPGAPAKTSATAPEMQPRGIAALPGAEQAGKMMVETMQKQSTPEGIYQAQRKMEGLYGLTQPAGEERMQRAGQMEAERKKMLEERGMERLMRVMGGIAGRGLQGAGPAYLSAIEGERASDVAFRKQMDELMGGVEEKRRAEQVAGMQRATTQMGKERELGIGAAEKIFDAQRRREEEELKQRWEVQKSRMMPNEAQMKQKLIDDIMRRNPNISFAEAYGKAMELSQGLTPEIKREQLRAKAYNEAAKMWEDMLVKPKDITREQWIEREVNNRLRTQASTEVPDDIGQLLKKYGGK